MIMEFHIIEHKLTNGSYEEDRGHGEMRMAMDFKQQICVIKA